MTRIIRARIAAAEIRAKAKTAAPTPLSFFYGYGPGDVVPDDLKRIDDAVARQHPSKGISGLGHFYAACADAAADNSTPKEVA